MAPHDLPPTSTATATKAEQHTLPAERPTSILHRTPWRPPTAVAASGIEITLEGGRTLVDAAGGAAVTCLGHGHPAVVRAIKEQADTLNCA
jgi:E3 ubiquitin-protein ligase TRIP12